MGFAPFAWTDLTLSQHWLGLSSLHARTRRPCAPSHTITQWDCNMAHTTLPRPKAPTTTQTKLLINNQWVDPVESGTFDTYNPATGEVRAKVAAASAKDVDKAVKAARKALESGPWATMDAVERG